MQGGGKRARKDYTKTATNFKLKEERVTRQRQIANLELEQKRKNNSERRTRVWN